MAVEEILKGLAVFGASVATLHMLGYARTRIMAREIRDDEQLSKAFESASKYRPWTYLTGTYYGIKHEIDRRRKRTAEEVAYVGSVLFDAVMIGMEYEETQGREV